jgi:ATP-dependent exoDNAse (exonuclease V) beta subunit
VRARERALLRWLEHPDYELLLAPIPPVSGDQQEPTYRAIGHILQDKDDLETLRLLYVAVTRAKSRLHLLGHARPDREGQLKPAHGSLLAVAWPALQAEFVARAVAANTPPEREKSPVKLRRLPLSWQPPPMPEPLAVAVQDVRLASAGGHYQEGLFQSLRTEEGRVIGTLVHSWLERITRDGVGRWPLSAVRGLTEQLGHQLRSQGVPGARLENCTRAILGCLITMLGSERGRWLLGDHRDAACELPLNGIVDGQLVHASIDRTFVDADGVRWVVDYKTVAPAREQDRNLFMAGEVERYAGQLRLYATLISQLKPDQGPPRAALYFPAFDGWVEVEVGRKNSDER